jgi:hypothetical protein
MAPHFKKVADKLKVGSLNLFLLLCGHMGAADPVFCSKGIAVVGGVDCDVESNKKLCAQFQIRSFPTIKVCST